MIPFLLWWSAGSVFTLLLCVKYVKRYYPNIQNSGDDFFMLILALIFGIIIWPLGLLGVLIAYLLHD